MKRGPIFAVHVKCVFLIAYKITQNALIQLQVMLLVLVLIWISISKLDEALGEHRSP